MTRISRAKLFSALALLAFGTVADAQDTRCRQALALGLDVSGSVDAREYRLQLDGIISALASPGVRSLLLSRPQTHVEIMVYEWSGPGENYELVGWTAIRTQADIAIIQETLRQTVRRAASPGTALGEAMRVGAAYLETRAECGKRTLDISGDGKANLGPDPADVRGEMSAKGITVNALVIGADAPRAGDMRQAEIGELSSYFRSRVIVGDQAFVQTSLGYEGYADAMARKLERELDGRLMSQADQPPR